MEDKKDLTPEEIITLYNQQPLKFISMEYNEKEIQYLIERLKENPKLFLYDFNLTDLVRYLLFKVEELESKLK